MPIGNNTPHANRDDVETQMLIAQETCIGDILDTTDPLVDPGDATTEGFPDGMAYACKIIWLRNESGELFYSTDDGGSYTALGGTASNSVILSSLVNRSGSQLDPSDVVIWDFTNELSVQTTTTRNDQNVAGIWQETTGALQSGAMLTRGIATVNVDSAVSIGDRLVTATTAGQVTPAAEGEGINGLVGYALEASVGAGSILALIDIQIRSVRRARYTYTVAQGTGGLTFTSGADRVVSLNTEVSDSHNIGSLSSNRVQLRPGIYLITASVQLISSGSDSEVRGHLYNFTGSTPLLVQSNMHIELNTGANLIVSGPIVLTALTEIEFRVRVTVNTIAGVALNISGETETYAVFDVIGLN